MAEKKIRVAIVGAGVAGSLLANGLMQDPRYEVFCFEKVTKGDRSQAGTGLNVGPNAIKTLENFFPSVAESLRQVSIPWETWTVSHTTGEPIISFPLTEVADNPGIRLFWSELYQQMRAPVMDNIIFAIGLGVFVGGCGRALFLSAGHVFPQDAVGSRGIGDLSGFGQRLWAR